MDYPNGLLQWTTQMDYPRAIDIFGIGRVKAGVNMKFGQTEQFFLLESSIASLFMIL